MAPILVIEDNLTNMELIIYLLEVFGYIARVRSALVVILAKTEAYLQQRLEHSHGNDSCT